MAQQASKPGNLSLVPGIHMVEVEKITATNCPLTSHAYYGTHVYNAHTLR